MLYGTPNTISDKVTFITIIRHLEQLQKYFLSEMLSPHMRRARAAAKPQYTASR